MNILHPMTMTYFHLFFLDNLEFLGRANIFAKFRENRRWLLPWVVDFTKNDPNNKFSLQHQFQIQIPLSFY